MEIKAYFEKTRGFGVLATANKDGRVDAAVYSRPHVMDDGTLAFIMNDRLTHQYLQTNSQATYLFKEDGTGYKGVRLFLTKIGEEQDTQLLRSLRRRSSRDADYQGPKFLVFFSIDQQLPLIGADEETE